MVFGQSPKQIVYRPLFSLRPNPRIFVGAAHGRDKAVGWFDLVAGMASSYSRAWMAFGQLPKQAVYRLLFSLRPNPRIFVGAVHGRDKAVGWFDLVAGMASSYSRAWMAFGQLPKQAVYRLLFSLRPKRLNR